MNQFLAILAVAAMAAVFLLISYHRKSALHPACDRFAKRYCELADGFLDDLDCTASLNVEVLDGGALRMRPIEEQPAALRPVLEKPVNDDVIAIMRDLYMLRDDIQARASNGSMSKNHYNAILNQLYVSVDTFLAIIQNPDKTFSPKDLEQFHYFLQKQRHIRNITLPAIVSKTCREEIAAS